MVGDSACPCRNTKDNYRRAALAMKVLLRIRNHILNEPFWKLGGPLDDPIHMYVYIYIYIYGSFSVGLRITPCCNDLAVRIAGHLGPFQSREYSVKQKRYPRLANGTPVQCP